MKMSNVENHVIHNDFPHCIHVALSTKTSKYIMGPLTLVKQKYYFNNNDYSGLRPSKAACAKRFFCFDTKTYELQKEKNLPLRVGFEPTRESLHWI